MVTRKDYGADAVAAARSVLIELTHLLSEYQDDLVIVGGWVPELLLPNADEHHIGSTDVDIAIDHGNIPETVYQTIQELLLSRGYEPGDKPFVFVRHVGNVSVEVDFLAGEYGGTGRNRRHQTVQEFKARKARGSDLAFELYREVEVTGTLPGGGRDTVKLRVASIVSFIVMKAAALAGRLKEKDAWDILFCLRNYPGGVEAIVEEIAPHVTHGLVQEAVDTLGDKFATVDSIGPKFVADFDGLEDAEARAFAMRDAFERVQYVVTKLRSR